MQLVGPGGPTSEAAPGRVLAIYAHPDDPEVAVGGTLASWAAEGSEVHLVICTAGEKGSSDPDVRPDELARRRAGEVEEAAAALGLAGHEVLGHPDGEVANDAELRARLVRRIRADRPDVVVSHDPTAVFFGASYVNHRDHREVGFAVLDACAPATSSPLYFPEAGPAWAVPELWLSGTLEPDTWVDVAGAVAAKAAALACHRSQLGEGVEVVGEVIRQRAEDAGREVGLGQAESFRRLHLS